MLQAYLLYTTCNSILLWNRFTFRHVTWVSDSEEYAVPWFGNHAWSWLGHLRRDTLHERQRYGYDDITTRKSPVV